MRFPVLVCCPVPKKIKSQCISPLRGVLVGVFPGQRKGGEKVERDKSEKKTIPPALVHL